MGRGERCQAREPVRSNDGRRRLLGKETPPQRRAARSCLGCIATASDGAALYRFWHPCEHLLPSFSAIAAGRSIKPPLWTSARHRPRLPPLAPNTRHPQYPRRMLPVIRSTPLPPWRPAPGLHVATHQPPAGPPLSLSTPRNQPAQAVGTA